jgi:hypothetical protein
MPISSTTGVGRFIDTWIFQNKTWVCVAAQATLLQP